MIEFTQNLGFIQNIGLPGLIILALSALGAVVVVVVVVVVVRSTTKPRD